MSIFFLSGCSSTRYLKENEYILYRNSLKNAPKDEYSNMTDIYRQESNRKFLGLLPYVNLYNFGKLFYDTVKIEKRRKRIIAKYDNKIEHTHSKSRKAKYLRRKEKKVDNKNKALTEGSSFMRSFGEPPVIYDSAKTNETAMYMKTYLFSKGYFHNKLTVQVDTNYRRKRISVRYLAEPGAPTLIKGIVYKIEDPRIDSLMNTSAFSKSIKLDERYDEEKLSNEREQIYRLLKDNGYFDFKRQFITYEADTTLDSNSVYLTLFVSQHHKVYRISKLYFNLDISDNEHSLKRDTFEYKFVTYTFTRRSYLRKLLDYKISTRPFDIYSQSKLQKTQRLLGTLDIYKFVNINVIENKQDTIGNTLTAYINTHPMSKFQLSQEYGMSIGQALVPGPFLSFTLKTRNLVRWLEVIENNIRYSLEAQYSIINPDQPYRTNEFSANTSFYLPQLLINTRLRMLVRDYNPRVKLFTGYNYVRRPEYRRETFKGGITYSFTPNTVSSFYLTPIDISFISSEVDPTFNAFLQELKNENGSNLYLSFRPSIVTSFQFSYVYNNHDLTTNRVSKYFRPSVEFGGFVPNIYTRAFGTQLEKDSNRLFNKQYFEFVRFGVDLRYYFPVKKKSTFVVRFNVGYAQPLGKSSTSDLFALPYEKYFFSGGNSSIRAWRPRRLGPGSYSENAADNYRFEQPGEILFETNLEMRFKIISIFDWAFFVDAGNVWSIKEINPGSQFKLPKSFNEIAVGAGAGLRLNFSFLILRLDMAYKVWDPARPLEDRLVKYRLKDAVINIGIGYPF